MNWNDLASSDLPSLTVYPPETSNLMQTLLSDKNTTTKTPSVLDDLLSFRQANATGASMLQPNLLNDETFSPPIETLENLIQRHEQTLLSTLVQHCTDETRQRTTKDIDDQLQQQWDKERAAFTRNSRGELIGKKSQEWLSPSPFRSTVIHDSISKSEKIDPNFVLSHLKIVEGMSQGSIMDSVEQFSRLATDESRKNKNATQMMAYESAWQLIANLVSVDHSPADQARATLRHFCKQFQVTVVNRVRQASLVGQNTNSIYSNDLTAQCEVFSRLTVGTTDPWAVCFYCLRCGDANAAFHALKQVQPLDEAVGRSLLKMVRAQGNSTCLWDVQASIVRLDRSDQHHVVTLFESPDNSTNVHKKAVLLLLSGNKPWPFNFEPTEGFQTIEDYLTGALWVASLQSNTVDHLIHIGEEVLNRGPSSFDDPSSGGWSFALPLLASQQYQKALLWLVQTGGPLGLLHATHIGLVLSFHGCSIQNLGQLDATGDETESSLLLAFSSDIMKEHGPLATFDYLARIPNKIRAYKEIAKLIATTSDRYDMYNSIVGTLNSDGIRQGGALSKYFNDSEVSHILMETSTILSLSTGEKHKQGLAVMCLLLAGRYDDALSTLNRLIAPPNIMDDTRYFWIEQVSSFHTHYLTKRTHVLDVLERCGRTSVIRTSQLLTEMNLFFDRFRTGNSPLECLQIAKKTQLLPETEDGRKIKESEFRDLDPLVQASMPFLLIGVMEILKEEHTQLKRDLHRDTSGVVRERLKELNEHATLLTSFASSLGIANCHIRTLSSLMSLMI